MYWSPQLDFIPRKMVDNNLCNGPTTTIGLLGPGKLILVLTDLNLSIYCHFLLSSSCKTEVVAQVNETDSESDEKDTALDGGYAWVALACVVCIQFLTTSAVQGGIFLMEFRDAFDLTLDQISWIVSLNCGLSLGCGEPTLVSFICTLH